MHQWPTSAHSEPPVLCFAHLTLFIAHQLDQLGPDHAFTRCMAELTRQHAATPQPQGPALPHCGRPLGPRALSWDIQVRWAGPKERCSMRAIAISHSATARTGVGGRRRTRVGGTSHSARDGACLGTVRLPAAQCHNRRQSAVRTGCCKAALRPSRQWRSMGCCRHEPARETLSRSLTLEEAFPVGRAIDMQ